MASKEYERPLTVWGFLWSLPVTLVGIAAVLLSLPSLRLKEGMVICRSNRGLAYLLLTRRGFAAITLGRILIVTKDLSLHLWHHEVEHARQAQRWGVLFIPLYLVNQARYGYRSNPFEVAARRVADSFKADNPNIAELVID
ncbi:MAG: hypothetical protein V3U95_00235 [Dehalococcoidia bacterium]|nr:hypothetical protein [Chloroflexota bacterium]MCZ6867791.1 hypothetical protein [Chloroflexota bacterium]